jgi:hypothetical protein
MYRYDQTKIYLIIEKAPDTNKKPVISTTTPKKDVDVKAVIKALGKYFWPKDTSLKARVVGAMGFLVAGKALNVAVPFFFKYAVDMLTDVTQSGALMQQYWFVSAPVAMIVACMSRYTLLTS